MTLTNYQCIEYGLYSTALSISSRGSFAHKCRRLLGLIIPKPEAHWVSIRFVEALLDMIGGDVRINPVGCSNFLHFHVEL